MASILGARGAPAADKPVLKPIDVFDLQWAAEPEISPDGQRIAYVRMRMDIKTDKPRGVIWLTDFDGREQQPAALVAGWHTHRLSRSRGRRLEPAFRLLDAE
jgi:dipeptidyl aminopeptidase/acylaminoacyl peptidase